MVCLTRRSLVIGLVVSPLLPGCAPLRSPRRSIELNIASDGDELAFTPDHLSCPTGADVRLFFHHTGEIIDDPHDWVLLKPGSRLAFTADADRQTDETQIIPPNDRALVIAVVPLCAKGQTGMVEFIAPEPGDYPFVCSVPGHGETMHGVLTVIP